LKIESNMEKIYDSLPLGKEEIRILTLQGSSNPEAKIRCTLRIASLTNTRPSYKALSYTWGKKAEGVILVDAKDADGNILVGEFSPKANLYDALQQFRKRKDGDNIDIWTDAICINQDGSDVEKIAQIDLMRDIFSTATESWVWLGTKRDGSEKAIGLIKRLSQVLRLQDPSPKYTETIRQDFPKTWGSGIKNELVALENLFVRDYWYRAWIVQEISVSKAVTLFCSDDSVSWDEVFDTAYFVDGGVGVKEAICEERSVLSESSSDKSGMIRSASGDLRDINSGIQRIVSIQSVRNDIQKTNGKGKELIAEPPDSLLFLLSNHRSTDSGYAVDKYIALAGLVKDRRPPSTKNVKDVYIWAALSIANQQKSYVRSGLALNFLDCAGLPVTGSVTKKNKALDRKGAGLPEEEFPELPSWVPDWSYHQPRASPLLHWQFSGNNDTSKVYFNAARNLSMNRDPSITRPVFTGKLLGSPCTETIQIHPVATGRSIGEEALAQDTLSAYGTQFDEVSGVGFYEDWSSFDTCKVQNGKEPEMSSVGSYPPAACEELEDVVWKTCVLNRTARGQRPPSHWGKLFYTHIQSQEWYKKNKGFKICGRTLKEITLSACKNRGNTSEIGTVVCNKSSEAARQSPIPESNHIPESNSESLNLLWTAFGIATGRRRLASTTLGYLCMAPFNTQLGDKIVALSDCHAPVVLRGENGHYRFIGTCYVHGIMKGELALMDGLVSQWFHIQ
jgi:hypothetical protein